MRYPLSMLTVAGLIAIAGCAKRDDNAPRAITADEDQRLNDAAAMLDNQSISMNALAEDDDNEDDQQ